MTARKEGLRKEVAMITQGQREGPLMELFSICTVVVITCISTCDKIAQNHMHTHSASGHL